MQPDVSGTTCGVAGNSPDRNALDKRTCANSHFQRVLCGMLLRLNRGRMNAHSVRDKVQMPLAKHDLESLGKAPEKWQPADVAEAMANLPADEQASALSSLPLVSRQRRSFTWIGIPNSSSCWRALEFMVTTSGGTSSAATTRAHPIPAAASSDRRGNLSFSRRVDADASYPLPCAALSQRQTITLRGFDWRRG